MRYSFDRDYQLLSEFAVANETYSVSVLPAKPHKLHAHMGSLGRLVASVRGDVDPPEVTWLGGYACGDARLRAEILAEVDRVRVARENLVTP